MGTYSTESATDSNYPHLPGVLVTPSWLVAHLDHGSLRILDARQPAHYAMGHIAGARNAPLERFSCTVDGVEGLVLPPEAYAEAMSLLGVSHDTPVVVYDDTWGLAAARLFWSLEYYGHHSVAVLNGGWDLWRAEGLPVDTALVDSVSTRFTARPDISRVATYDWLQAKLGQVGPGEADMVVVDTRSSGEYANGHLPGALSWDWMNATAPGSWETMRDPVELGAELQRLGVVDDKEIVVYCRSGVRAAHTYLVLRALAYPRVRNYDGSWLDWEVQTACGDRAEASRAKTEGTI